MGKRGDPDGHSASLRGASVAPEAPTGMGLPIVRVPELPAGEHAIGVAKQK